jgi:hypothetical protein
MDSETPILKQNGQEKLERAASHPDKGNNEKGWYEEWQKKWKNMTLANKLMVSFTGVIALCTVIYAVVAYFQWTALIESNKINRDALESVQRAYVNFSTAVETTIVLDPYTHKANTWKFTVPMENSGVTPTRRMIAHADQWNNHDRLPDDFTYPDTGNLAPQLIPLGPKGKTGLGPISITPDVIEALESVPTGGSWHLYFYGWAKYRDVFPGTPEHITKFCYEMTQVSGNPYFPKKEEMYSYFSACPHHNCTDEECKAEKPN